MGRDLMENRHSMRARTLLQEQRKHISGTKRIRVIARVIRLFYLVSQLRKHTLALVWDGFMKYNCTVWHMPKFLKENILDFATVVKQNDAKGFAG